MRRNLTQRSNEFREELDNLLAIRKYLTTKTLSDHVVRPQGGGTQPKCDSSSAIANWLDKNSGDVMKRSKIKKRERI